MREERFQISIGAALVIAVVSATSGRTLEVGFSFLTGISSLHPYSLIFGKGIVAILALIIFRQTISQSFRFRNFSWFTTAKILILIVTCSIIIRLLLSDISALIEKYIPISQQVNDFYRQFNSANVSFLGSLIGATILAPIEEEIIFRGIILKGLMRRYSVLVSLVISSVLFAASHIRLEIFYFRQAIYVLPVGVYLGWLYLKSDSVIFPIVAHAIYNSIGYLGEILAVHKNPSPPTQLSSYSPNYVSDISLLFGALLCLLLINYQFKLHSRTTDGLRGFRL